VGRFLTPDPYRASGGPAAPQSWNRYAYVEGDPVNRFDPTGLYPCGSVTSQTGDLISITVFDCQPSPWQQLWELALGGTAGGRRIRPVNEYERELAARARLEESKVRAVERGIHTFLDLAGLVPGPGEVADLLNALIYAGEGDPINAAMSVAAVLPIGGQAVAAAKGFRKGLQDLTSLSGAGMHAHHVFPEAFKMTWEKLGVAWNSAANGSWWEARDHLRKAWQYNQDWLDWIDSTPDATASDAMQYAQELAKKYGFTYQP
jgi:hypothetical protein